MKEVYVFKEVKEITKIAKNIFGDIVNNVYYADVLYDGINLDYLISKIDRDINNASNTNLSIDQCGINIVIEFINGQKVFFSNSEWGSMESFNNTENVIYVWTLILNNRWCMYYNLIRRTIYNKFHSRASGFKRKKQQIYFFGTKKLKLLSLMNSEVIQEDLYFLSNQPKILTKKDRFQRNMNILKIKKNMLWFSYSYVIIAP